MTGGKNVRHSQRQLRWLGHVITDPYALKPASSSPMLIGQRPVGRPKLRFSDHIKSVLQKCDIPEADLEQQRCYVAHAKARARKICNGFLNFVDLYRTNLW